VINGTTTVTNNKAFVLAFERVGVRLCSRIAEEGHLRETATCPHKDALAGKAVACTWRILLPAPPEVGANTADWSGIMRCGGEGQRRVCVRL
jgi:hypothetical protein